jgi:hypothetical protein
MTHLREGWIYYKVFKCLVVMQASKKLPATKEQIYSNTSIEVLDYNEVCEVIQEMYEHGAIMEQLDGNHQPVGYCLF